MPCHFVIFLDWPKKGFCARSHVSHLLKLNCRLVGDQEFVSAIDGGVRFEVLPVAGKVQ